MIPAGAALIAVDWGTTRLRAYLVDADGEVLDRVVAAESGIQSVPANGFPAALDTACGHWFAQAEGLPVLMAGMVGSRNGWAEASYVAPPCGVDSLASALLPISGASRPIFIVPGVDCRGADGSYDVMRGEETQAIGVGARECVVCLPGTHSKWVEIEDGRISRFATFVTGELYAALTASFVGRLAREPDDLVAGASVARSLAALPGGLTRSIFQARTQVLGAGMAGEAVRPFLSSLLIEHEVRGAREMFGTGQTVHLVAGPPQVGVYVEALTRLGFTVEIYDPESTTLTGLTRLAQAAGLLQQPLA